MEQNEPALIRRILDGETAQYKVLIDRYKTGLYHHCFKFVRDEDQAEDIVQEAFIKAYLQLERYNPHYRFSTWLYKIATNIALQQLRKHQPRLLEDDEIAAIISTLPSTDQLAKDNELVNAVAELPHKQQQVIHLRYFEGKSYAQIAERLGTTTGAVKGWMGRAKQQLKEMLQ